MFQSPARPRIRCRRSESQRSLRLPAAACAGAFRGGDRAVRHRARQHRLVRLQFDPGKPGSRSSDRDIRRRADARPACRRDPAQDGCARDDGSVASRSISRSPPRSAATGRGEARHLRGFPAANIASIAISNALSGWSRLSSRRFAVAARSQRRARRSAPCIKLRDQRFSAGGHVSGFELVQPSASLPYATYRLFEIANPAPEI